MTMMTMSSSMRVKPPRPVRLRDFIAFPVRVERVFLPTSTLGISRRIQTGMNDWVRMPEPLGMPTARRPGRMRGTLDRRCYVAMHGPRTRRPPDELGSIVAGALFAAWCASRWPAGAGAAGETPQPAARPARARPSSRPSTSRCRRSLRQAAQPGRGAAGRGRRGTAPRAQPCRPPTTSAPGSPHRRPRPGRLGTCWAFANLAAVESRLLPGQRWDFSEDNLVTRSGYGPFRGGRYDWGGWDFMAVAYLTRWAGPVERDATTATTRPSRPRPTWRASTCRASSCCPGRTGFLDNDLLKQMVVENGALSVGMFWDSDASLRRRPRGHTGRHCDSPPATTFEGIEVGRESRRRHRRLGRHLPCGSILRFEAASRRATARSSHATAGAPDGATAATSGSRTTTARSPSTTARELPRVERTGNYTRNYQYDTLGWTRRWATRRARPSVAWAANRFTAKARERIVAAGFYAPVAGTALPGVGRRSLGSLTLRGAGRRLFPGSSRSTSATPLTVRAGAQVRRRRALDAPGDAHPIAVERPPRRGSGGPRPRPARASCATATATRGSTSPTTPERRRQRLSQGLRQ